MNILAIDHGNEYIKTEHHVFPASVVKYNYEPPMANEWIFYKGDYYCLSNTPSGYKRDKTIDEDYMILTLFAAAKENINMKEPVVLALDLPPMHFGALKDKYTNYFLNAFRKPVHYIYHNEKDTDCQLQASSVKVFPQGFAAMAAYVSDKKIFKDSDFLLIDIGGYTVDIIPFEENLPVSERCATRELGILKMCSSIKDFVCAKSGRQVSVRDIEKVINGKKTSLPDDIKKLILALVDDWSRKILSAAAEKVEDFPSTQVVFIGGGACLLEKYLKHTNATFVRDQLANAKGCLKLAKL